MKNELTARARMVAAAGRRLSWSLARTTPEAIRRRAQARLDRMRAENEPFRRMGKAEHERVLREIMTEEASVSGAAASVARFQLEPHVGELAAQYSRFVGQCRRDVAASFPDALDRVDANGMLMFALLGETLRPVIANASAADLLRRYARALETKDARGRIEAELIEERAEFGGLAATPDDLPIVRQLNDYISGVQDLRVPFTLDETREIEDTIETGRKSVNYADLAHVRPVDVSHPANANAKAAFDSEAGEYQAAIEAAALAAAAGE